MVDSVHHAREVVSIGVGQMGIQCATSIWRLYCTEHDISTQGVREVCFDSMNYEVFFYEASSGQLVPRACLFDLEPSVIDQIQNTNMKTLFDPEKCIIAPESGADVYARGRYVASKDVQSQMDEQVRKSIENCNHLSYVHFLNASGGGTGSGLSVNIGDAIRDNIGFTSIMDFVLQPSLTYRTSPVEYMNCLLYLGAALVDGPMKYSIQFDNESLYRFVPKKLKATYWHTNLLMAYTISGITARMRFDGDLGYDVNDIETNLVPYPSLSFLLASYCPLQFGKRKCDEKSITTESFNMGEFISVDTSVGQYICSTLLYRGTSCCPYKVNQACAALQAHVEFVPWMPTGLKIGISAHPLKYPTTSPWSEPKMSLTKLANHGSQGDLFRRYRDAFEPSYDMKAFVHHFINAQMEQSEFLEALDKTDSVITQYELATNKLAE